MNKSDGIFQRGSAADPLARSVQERGGGCRRVTGTDRCPSGSAPNEGLDPEFGRLGSAVDADRTCNHAGGVLLGNISQKQTAPEAQRQPAAKNSRKVLQAG